jgi:hypothetical protein
MENGSIPACGLGGVKSLIGRRQQRLRAFVSDG